MSTRDIEKEWRAVSYFLAKGPSASVQYLNKDVRAQMFALKAQVLDGDCPPGQDGSLAMDPALRTRQVSQASQLLCPPLLLQVLIREKSVAGSLERPEGDVQRGSQEEIRGSTVRDVARMEELERRACPK